MEQYPLQVYNKSVLLLLHSQIDSVARNIFSTLITVCQNEWQATNPVPVESAHGRWSAWMLK